MIIPSPQIEHFKTRHLILQTTRLSKQFKTQPHLGYKAQ
jgi:hypothetical protein